MFLYSLATTLKLLGVISFVNVLPNVTFLSRRDILRHRQGRTIIIECFTTALLVYIANIFKWTYGFCFNNELDYKSSCKWHDDKLWISASRWEDVIVITNTQPRVSFILLKRYWIHCQVCFLMHSLITSIDVKFNLNHNLM